MNRMEEDSRENILGTEPVGKLIAKFAIPTIVAFLVSTAYNITDQIFIGKVVGFYGIATTTVVFPLVHLLLAISQLVGVGMAANFNIKMGAKEEEEAKKFLGNGLSLMLISAVFLFLLVYFTIDFILIAFGATKIVFPYARAYLSITNIGLPFILIVIASNNIIRADGSPKFSLVSTIFGAVLNVFFDWLFMFVFHMGIRGAAWATVIGQFASFLFVLYYYTHFKTFKIRLSMLKLDFKYVVQIFGLGLANFLNQIINMFFNIILNNVLGYYGGLSVYGSEIPLAVAGVVGKVSSILLSISVGLAQACQPILGFNIGAKKYDRVRETIKKALTIAISFSLLFFLTFQLIPETILGFFGEDDAAYLEFGSKFLRIFMFMVITFAIQPLSINYFTAIGDVKSGIVLSIVRQGMIIIPALLILPNYFGINGVLFAGPIADALSCTLAMLMVGISYNKLRKSEEDLGRIG